MFEPKMKSDPETSSVPPADESDAPQETESQKVKRHARNLERAGWFFFIAALLIFVVNIMNRLTTISETPPGWVFIDLAGGLWGTSIVILFYAQLLHIRANTEK